jgi:hypothetical protein
MSKAIHKGTELNNIKETWQQNERANGANPENDPPTGVPDDLQKVIKEEAAEYDNADKEERLLRGDRATVSDDE